MTPVLIRTDASREIGLGHLARCLSLAGALRSLGGQVTFLMRAPDAEIARRVADQGFACEQIDAGVVPGSSEDAAMTCALAERLGPDCVAIVDHYRIAGDWEQSVRSKVRKLAVIDDIADRTHDCDVLVDQNRPFDGAAAYRDLVPADCDFLVGPRFALLRPEFAAWRSKPRPRNGEIRRVLISFGGSDPGRHTQVAMSALSAFAGGLEHVDVVVGPLNPARAEITEKAWSERVHVHFDPSDLAGLLHAADLAIGAGGVSSWERLCLSLPAVAVGIVPNQFQIIRDLLRLGVAVGHPDMAVADENAYGRWLELLLSSPDLVLGMSERAGAVVDGMGAGRVAQRLLSGQEQI